MNHLLALFSFLLFDIENNVNKKIQNFDLQFKGYVQRTNHINHTEFVSWKKKCYLLRKMRTCNLVTVLLKIILRKHFLTKKSSAKYHNIVCYLNETLFEICIISQIPNTMLKTYLFPFFITIISRIYNYFNIIKICILLLSDRVNKLS